MKSIIGAALLLAVAGCATKYQDIGFSGGVAAQQVTADTYRIVARGNGYTSNVTIQDYALLKAAETTKAAGCTHFLILSGNNATQVSQVQTSGYAQTNIVGRTAYTTYTPGETVNIVKPGQDAYIKVLRIPPGQSVAGSFSADEIIQYIGPRVERAS